MQYHSLYVDNLIRCMINWISVESSALFAPTHISARPFSALMGFSVRFMSMKDPPTSEHPRDLAQYHPPAGPRGVSGLFPQSA